MNDCGGASALDLSLKDWTKRGTIAKGAGRRLPPRPAACKIMEEMNASLDGAC